MQPNDWQDKPAPAHPAFAMFWAGETLPGYEAACMSSFVRHGYRVAVYSYGKIVNLPDGVLLRSAQDIVDERFVNAFLIKDVPSLSHFSDLFRYRLFQRSDFIYADTDLYLLRPFDIDLPRTLLAREDKIAICGAIMRLDQADPALAQLVAHVEQIAGRNLAWGETGPRLLTNMLGGAEIAGRSFPPETFYPIHYNDFWKVFLPEYREECEAHCRNAYTIHLWNNIVTKVGIWKDVLPPAGSYLEQKLVADGMGHLFRGTYPAGAMRHVIDNYRMRLSGDWTDITRMLRLTAPGVKRRAARVVYELRNRWGAGRRADSGATKKPGS